MLICPRDIAHRGNLSYRKTLLTVWKKTFRIVIGTKPRNSYKALFNKLEVLFLPFEYMCL
jgi:hypothetical protein